MEKREVGEGKEKRSREGKESDSRIEAREDKGEKEG